MQVHPIDPKSPAFVSETALQLVYHVQIACEAARVDRKTSLVDLQAYLGILPPQLQHFYVCQQQELMDLIFPVEKLKQVICHTSECFIHGFWCSLSDASSLWFLRCSSHIVPGGGHSMLSCFFTSKASAHSLYWILLKVSPCLACSLSARFWTLSAFSSKADIFFFLHALVGLFSSSSEPDESITIDADRACLWGLEECEESPSHQSWPPFPASFSSGGQFYPSL